METVSLDDVDAFTFGANSERRGLSARLETATVALNRYRIAPGDGLPGGLHAHADQEEAFVVLEGTAVFETMSGEITVEENETIRFEPGEFQSGRNGSADELVVLAAGAPRRTEDIRLPVPCAECDREALRLNFGGDELTFVCPGCGAEFVPAPCPACGHDDLRLALNEANRTVTVCQECDCEFERPPLRGDT
ncbi:cupin domain-containing protein (plasmid) [Haloferacaceae archaeon DSL9]